MGELRSSHLKNLNLLTEDTYRGKVRDQYLVRFLTLGGMNRDALIF